MTTELEQLREELAESERQIVMLRDAILAICCDPEGTVCIRGSDGDRAVLQEALDATDDLSGCILCDAEPVIFSDRQTEPLFKAKEK